jgi:hypothetical protein
VESLPVKINGRGGDNIKLFPFFMGKYFWVNEKSVKPGARWEKNVEFFENLC